MADDAYIAQLYMVMKGCERELKKHGYGGDGQPMIPTGTFEFKHPLLIRSDAVVKRSNEGTGGNGRDEFAPTCRGLNLKTVCFALHRNGFNMENTARVIGDSIEASLNGEADKAMDAVPEVVEERKNIVLEQFRDHVAYRPTCARITPGRKCFLQIEKA